MLTSMIQIVLVLFLKKSFLYCCFLLFKSYYLKHFFLESNSKTLVVEKTCQPLHHFFVRKITDNHPPPIIKHKKTRNLNLVYG